MIRYGVSRLLTDEGIEIVAAFADASELLDAVATEEPDVLVVDVGMPPTFQTERLEAALDIRRQRPETAVLVVGRYIETRYAPDLLAEGAIGLGSLEKDRVTQLDDFLDALHRVAAGGTAIDPAVVERLVRRPRAPARSTASPSASVR